MSDEQRRDRATDRGPAQDADPQPPWGTFWDLQRAADDAVDWSAVHVTLGLQDGRVGGKAPVNRYFGTVQAGPGGALAVGELGLTMMAGPPHAMAAETAYLALLARVARFEATAESLTLRDDAGRELLLFRPSTTPH